MEVDSGTPFYTEAFLNSTYTLSSEISAMQLLPSGGDNQPRLGPVSKLPSGARLLACGHGYNDRTLKVAYGGQYFYIFEQDLYARG